MHTTRFYTYIECIMNCSDLVREVDAMQDKPTSTTESEREPGETVVNDGIMRDKYIHKNVSAKGSGSGYTSSGKVTERCLYCILAITITVVTALTVGYVISVGGRGSSNTGANHNTVGGGTVYADPPGYTGKEEQCTITWFGYTPSTVMMDPELCVQVNEAVSNNETINDEMLDLACGIIDNYEYSVEGSFKACHGGGRVRRELVDIHAVDAYHVNTGIYIDMHSWSVDRAVLHFHVQNGNPGERAVVTYHGQGGNVPPQHLACHTQDGKGSRSWKDRVVVDRTSTGTWLFDVSHSGTQGAEVYIHARDISGSFTVTAMLANYDAEINCDVTPSITNGVVQEYTVTGHRKAPCSVKITPGGTYDKPLGGDGICCDGITPPIVECFDRDMSSWPDSCYGHCIEKSSVGLHTKLSKDIYDKSLCESVLVNQCGDPTYQQQHPACGSADNCDNVYLCLRGFKKTNQTWTANDPC